MANMTNDNENKVLNDRKRKLKRRKIRTAVILVLVAVVLFGLFECYSFYMQNGRWPWKKETAPSVVQELTTQAYESRYNTQIDISGSVQAIETQEVKIRATGAVTGVYVEEGDRVVKGQLLATVDDTDQQYTVASLEKQIEVARVSRTTSQRDIELLEMQLESARKKVEYTKAYANFDGVVVSVSISEGDYFDAGSAVMTIIDDSKLKATVEIDEIDIQMVELGMPASLTSDAVPGKPIQARVSYIPMVGRYSSQGIGVMDVEIVVDNPPVSLKPGFSFEGTIPIESEQVMLLVPQAAVTTSNGVSSVVRLNSDGTRETVAIQVKYLGENVYQVLSGDIKAGDTLVYTPNSGNVGGFMSMMGGPSMGAVPMGSSSVSVIGGSDGPAMVF